jgi:O-antigen/teichoic acid export membrane protein
MDLAKQFVVGSAWAFFGKISSLGLGFATNIILARIMSPDELGAYFLIVSIATVAALVGQLGMNQAVVRFVAGNIACNQISVARANIVKVCAVVAVGSCLSGVLYVVLNGLVAEKIFATPIVATATGLVFFWIIASALRGIAAECFRGLHDVKMASLFELFAYAFFFFVLIVTVWLWSDERVSLHSVVYLSTIAATISAAWALLVLGKKNRPMSAVNATGAVGVRELFCTGWPLLISNLVVVVMTQAGLWIVGIVATSTDVALYGAAFRIVVLLQLPLLIVNAVIPQHIAEMYVKGKREELERLLRMAAAGVFIPTIVLYGIVIIWGKWVLMLFGAYYTDGYLVLVLLGSGVAVNAWAGFCGPALMMTGRQLSLMKISIMCGLITLSAAFWFGRIYGKEGVAVAMSFGLALQHIAIVLSVKAHLGIWSFAGQLVCLSRRLRVLVG